MAIHCIPIRIFTSQYVQSFVLPIFNFYAKSHYDWSVYKTALVFGALIGFLWDALQGGIIEYSTFNMPLEVVLVDSTFHTIERIYTALILALFTQNLTKHKMKQSIKLVESFKVGVDVLHL